MSTRKGAFVKVGENLYRYSSSKVYYGVFRRGGKLNWKSLETDDREFAQRRLQELLSKIEKIDPRQRNLSLGELIALYEDGLGKFDVRTQANKRSLVKCLRDTWKHGFEIPVRDVSEAHLSVWLAKQRQRMSRTGYNAYVLFVRQLFDLAVAARAIPDSPAKGFRMEPRESPIRQTPSPDQFEKIVVNVRSQKLNDDAEDSADLIEFMGLAGIGLAECAHLKGEHVDFATHKIWLYRHKTDIGGTNIAMQWRKSSWRRTVRLCNSLPSLGEWSDLRISYQSHAHECIADKRT